MTVYALSIRLLLKDKGDSKTFTFITTLFGGIVILFLLPFEKISYVFNFQIIIVLLLLSFAFAITDLLFIRGRQLEEVSNVSILVQLGNFWSLIGGAIIFKEVLTMSKLIAVGLIVLGSILLVWHKQKIKLTRGKYLIILATLLFTLCSFVDKKLSSYFSASLYKGLLFISEAMILFLFFLIKAFQAGGEASKVLPVFSLSLVFSVLAGIIFLKEREHIIKKIVSMILVLIGVFLLQMF